MDFAFTEEQAALRDLVKRIFRERVTDSMLREVEAGVYWSPALWATLGESELLSLGWPEARGGSGLGLLEVCILLEQVGASVAPIPAWPTLLLGADAIARCDDSALAAEWLPGVGRGETLLTGAFARTGRIEVVGGRISGVLPCVPFAVEAKAMVVPTAHGCFLVPLDGAGVSIEAQLGTNHWPLGAVTLSGSTAIALGDPAFARAQRLRAELGLCAMLYGLSKRAVRLTAEHTKTRHQFGRAIATFQAVSQRAADAYIDVEGMGLTLWRAAWLADHGDLNPEVVATAKFTAVEGGHRVVNAAQHLHGGMGFLRDYPLHRYFLWAKQLEFFMGGRAEALRTLGDLLAEEAIG